MATPVLLGPDGQPIDRSVLTQRQAEPTLTGIRTVLAEHPSSGLTPGRLAQLLRASEEGDATGYLELAEDMEEKDLHYRGVLMTRRLAVSQLELTVEAASDSADDVANADLVRDFIARDDIEDILFDILDGIGKGYSVTEIVWETSARQWMPKELLWRDPRWFQFDRVDGRTLRLKDGGSFDGADLPPFKYIIHTPKTKSGLPLRGGLARAAAWSYLFKNLDLKDWVIFAEVYGMPIRVGRYGPEASPEDKEVLLRALRNIGSDAAAMIPKGMDIEFIAAKSSGTGTGLWKELADWLDQQVSKAVLGQTTTTDAISGGHAVSKEHQEVRRDIERADAKQLAGALNGQLVRPIVDLNRGPQNAYPRLIIGRKDNVDIAEMSDALAKLVPVGLKVGMSTVRDRLGFPDPAPDEEVLAPAPGSGAAKPTLPAPALQAAGAGPVHDAVDAVIAQLLDDEGWRPLMEPIAAPLEQLFANARSYDELRAGLAGVFARMDDAKLADLLARLKFNARLAGESEQSLTD